MKHTRMDGIRPLARFDDLVVTESGNEVLVYDQQVHAIHHLDSLATLIWQACDRVNDVPAIQARCSASLIEPVSEEAVLEVLQRLADLGLMQGWPEAGGISGVHSSRRKMLKRTTVVGAAIASVTVPLASAHASGGTEVCAGFRQTCNQTISCCADFTCDAPGEGMCV